MMLSPERERERERVPTLRERERERERDGGRHSDKGTGERRSLR